MSEVADRPLWEPSPEAIERSQMKAFWRRAEELSGLRFREYADLWQWSVDERPAFWRLLWDWAGVDGEPGDVTVEDGDAMPGARWFPRGKLSFAANLLPDRGSHTALVHVRENGYREEVSYAELRQRVARVRGALRAMGVGPGDRVAAVLPNGVEAVVAMLATASLGAIWSSTSPDFGATGILDRFGQIEPRVLLGTDAYRYRGKRYDCRDKLVAVAENLSSVEHRVLVPYEGETDAPSGWGRWRRLADTAPDDSPLERFDFGHPLYILYSSGTTGKPKCIVHSAGGTLLQHLKEHRLHTDLRPDDVLFYYTTTGWMMWNWLVSGLATGATIVAYDGHPAWPAPDALWTLADDIGITVFGTSAKYLDAQRKAGVRPAHTHDLTRLRAILSTGSPLAPESFDYVYADIKRDVLLASISGGTDIVSCFVLGCPVRPVWRGEIQCRGLGMAVDVFDEDGRPVRGQPGELVCTRPFPSMPLGFWNDPDGERYRAAYFARWPGVWRHGDWATITEHDGVVIYGRSDATLNPGGVRIGTAEIYRVVEQFDEILEAVAVGQRVGGDERIVLFVRLAPGATLDDALRERIRRALRAELTPRHVPARILAVTDIPRTRSGKISEIAVRAAVEGRPVRNTEALANPEVLEQFRDRPELAT